MLFSKAKERVASAAGRSMEPWKFSRSGWLARTGVHEPYIGEVSPAQMGLMSARQRTAYEKRRTIEWSVSTKAKSEWSQAVIAGYEAFAFDPEDTELSDDARREVASYRAANAAKRQAELAADRALELVEEVPFADVRVGDVLHSRLGRVKVLKKNRVTLRCAQVATNFEVTLRDTRFVRERA